MARLKAIRQEHLCEDCGEPQARRKRCHHCGWLVCRWCWHHVHRCEPSHTKKECRDLQKV